MTPDAQRKAVAYLCDTHEVRQRRACAALSVDRSTVRYQSKRVDDVKQSDAIIESFNGKLRDEFLNETLFSTLADARKILEIWKEDYNTERPHSALGNIPPKRICKEIRGGLMGRLISSRQYQGLY